MSRPAELARRLPDEPRWIDLSGMLRSGRCDVWSEEAPAVSFVARSWDHPFAATWGTPSRKLLEKALHGAPSGLELLVPAADATAVRAALPPGWTREEGVWLHRYQGGDPAPRPAEGAVIRLLPGGEDGEAPDLGHLSGELARELAMALDTRRPLAVTEVGGRGVSFCYAPYETETLWDVSIETLEGHRRRGHAAACFHALRRHLAGRGKAPVWGAHDSNPASLALAAKLGFVRDARLVCFSRPRDGS